MNVMRLPHNLDLPLPAYETPGSAGMDLRAAVQTPVSIEPRERKLIPTGLAMSIPLGYAGLVCSRSGLATKFGISVLPTPGVIDSDYRGEVMITMINLGRESFVVNRGDRIAQLLVTPVKQEFPWNVVTELDTTERGVGGFGSTGVV